MTEIRGVGVNESPLPVQRVSRPGEADLNTKSREGRHQWDPKNRRAGSKRRDEGEQKMSVVAGKSYDKNGQLVLSVGPIPNKVNVKG